LDPLDSHAAARGEFAKTGAAVADERLYTLGIF
jgi:hypothetical protein